MIPAAAPRAPEVLAWAAAAVEVVRDAGAIEPGPFRLRMLEPGPGGRSLVVSAASRGRRRYVLKIRLDPDDPATREAWALEALGGSVAPRLVARLTGAQLTGGAESKPPVGGCLVLEHLDGVPPTSGRDRVALAARCIARLHAFNPPSGPELLCPSSPEVLLLYSSDLAERLAPMGLLAKAELRRVGRALNAGVRQLHAVAYAALPKGAWALCHGDLRWHNMRRSRAKIRLLDLELAGRGDPAVDLALMVCRTPLSDASARRLLEHYLQWREDPSLVERYQTLLPLVGLVSALSAVIATAGRARRRAHAELDRALLRFP